MASTACSLPTPALKRLYKELMILKNDPPAGVSISEETLENLNSNGEIYKWLINMDGAAGTLYEGEQFQLQFIFTEKYPFASPVVTFVGSNIPVHPHIYSNGHICLSILTDDWSPALSIGSVCLSLLSMLSSCKEKVRPRNDDAYVQKERNPKYSKWVFDDDNI